MKPIVRLAFGVVGMIVIFAPLSVLATILLLPFWSWLEAWTGIESVGHSGPAEWCYGVTYILFVAAGLLWLFLRQRRRRIEEHGP